MNLYMTLQQELGMAVDMVEGAFSFVSGEIAKTGPDAMKVSTPVATIGIREPQLQVKQQSKAMKPLHFYKTLMEVRTNICK